MTADEILDLQPGALGAAQIHLQVRGNKYNMKEYNVFDPTSVLPGDNSAGAPLSAYDTLSLEQSNADSYGRIITVNNLSGRVLIRNFMPSQIDTSLVPYL